MSKINDSDRIEEFLTILPEGKVKTLWINLANKTIYADELDMLEVYLFRKDQVSFQFDNELLQKYFTELNDAISKMVEFGASNFVPKKGTVGVFSFSSDSRQNSDTNVTEFSEEIVTNLSVKYTDFLHKAYSFMNKVGGLNKIKLYVDRASNPCRVYRTYDGKVLTCVFSSKSERFKYIEKIIQHGKISGKQLRGSKTFQALSTEISEINKRLRKELNISRDVVVNSDNSGYTIDEIYELNFA